MEDSPKYHGSLVAFEGPSDTISTQLRLLPTSPQILVLPSIQQYLNRAEIQEPFNARHFIRQVHTAATARHEAALQFLQQSTPEQKRVVFMNGGTIGAQALCISAISKNETNGDLTRADSVFSGLVRDGVSGLSKDIATWRNSVRAGEDAHMNNFMEDNTELKEQEQAQDPIIEAMRAADALDRETESLQPPSCDLDLATNRLTRSLSLSVLDFTDKFQDSTPFFVFGASSENSSTAPTTINSTPVKDVEMSEALRKRPTRISIAASACRSHAGEVFDASAHSFSPLTDAFTSPPVSPDKVEFGEAQMVQMDSATRKALQKVKSLDRIFLSSERARDGISPTLLEFDLSLTSTPTKVEKRRTQKQRPVSCVGVSRSNVDSRSSVHYLDIPKAVFVKANKTTITRSPTRSTASSHSRRHRRAKPLYVDKGVDAPVFLDLDDSDVEERNESPFEPVLPMVEDRVVHFKDESQNELLELVLHGFKDGVYPVLARNDPSASDAPVAMPATPTSQRSRSASDRNRISLGAVQRSEPAIMDTDEYDPYAPHGTYKLNNCMRKQTVQTIKTTNITQISAPSPTPVSAKSESDKRFYIFSVASRHTAVNAQNRLRSLLSTFFHAEDGGYRSFHFPLLPEMGSLWKPIMRQTESSTIGGSNSEEKIDLILAIGAQKGVKKEYSSAITGQIEKLGVKPSGLSRSGRLELRYFIAQAMQAFTAQPLANQIQDNPLTNHTLLATLVIHHLETYLAVHSDVRFLLLEYSAEHLSTVLALQKLIGSDIVKVAGILDGEDSEPVPPVLPPIHPRTRPLSRGVSGREGLDSINLSSASPNASVSSAQLSAHNLSQSFSKANFLLTSSATDSEIATFISTIWKILISVSSYYIPEHVPRKVASHGSLRKPGNKVGAAISAIENTYTYPREQSITSATPPMPITPNALSISAVPALPTVPTSPGMPARPPSPAESVKSRPSFSTSIRSGRSSRTWRTNVSKSGRLRSLRSKRGRDKESIYGWVDREEDDEDYDLEVRRVMPMFVRRRDMHTQKANSRKALKWLGLA